LFKENVPLPYYYPVSWDPPYRLKLTVKPYKEKNPKFLKAVVGQNVKKNGTQTPSQLPTLTLNTEPGYPEYSNLKVPLP